MHEPTLSTLENYKARDSIDFDRKSQPLPFINLDVAYVVDPYKSHEPLHADE